MIEKELMFRRPPLFAALSAALFLVLAAAFAQTTAVAPTQPIPFSHKQHSTAASLQCKDCHAMPDPGEALTMPGAPKCMACHQSIKADSPSIQQLKQFRDSKRDVPWVRVYQIPAFVFFSHKVHVEHGATCETCHGPVATRDVLAKETDLSMGACMNCHSAHKAPLDCNACHDLNNR